MATCPKCDAHIIDGAASCEFCGAVLKTKKKFSVICLVGFILGLLSLLSAVAAAAPFIFLGSDLKVEFKAGIIIAGIIASAVFLVLAVIVSIIGLVNAKKKDRSGKVFGIFGIVLSCIVLLVFVIYGAIVGLLMSCLDGLSRSKEFTSDEYRYADYGVLYNDKKDKAAILKYYWDGNPANNLIDLAAIEPDGVKVTSLGSKSKLLPTGFTIELADPGKDFYKSERYLNSRAANTSWIPAEDCLEDFGIAKGTIVNFEDIVFTVRMDKNIDNAVVRQNNLTLGIINPDGSITFYRYYYYFDVSSDNPDYYSKDGVLYDWYSNREVFFQHPYKPELTE